MIRGASFRLTGFVLVACAMFGIAGGHWAVFQSVAWAKMLADYSENSSVSEAVRKTFSGEAPCSMCKSINTERQKEQKAPATVKVDKKAEVFVAQAAETLRPPRAKSFSHAPVREVFATARRDAPPAPVPIRAS